MSVSEAITAARNLPTQTPHHEGLQSRRGFRGLAEQRQASPDTEPPATTFSTVT